MKYQLFVLCALAYLRVSEAFTPPRSNVGRSKIILNLDATELTAEQIAARSNFFIWFFGASGAAGIARSSFPRMYSNVLEIQNYKGIENSKGGEMVGVSPLCGYPRDISVADLDAVVHERPGAHGGGEVQPVGERQQQR